MLVIGYAISSVRLISTVLLTLIHGPILMFKHLSSSSRSALEDIYLSNPQTTNVRKQKVIEENKRNTSTKIMVHDSLTQTVDASNTYTTIYMSNNKLTNFNLTICLITFSTKAGIQSKIANHQTI